MVSGSHFDKTACPRAVGRFEGASRVTPLTVDTVLADGGGLACRDRIAEMSKFALALLIRFTWGVVTLSSREADSRLSFV
jgi:hypothetical protein